MNKHGADDKQKELNTVWHKSIYFLMLMLYSEGIIGGAV